MPSVLVKTENLKKYFETRNNNGSKRILKAVDDITFSIFEGETFSLVGESGCGKSTLGRSILALYPPTGGKIYFKDKDITKLSGKQLKDFRYDAQLIFQDPSACLNPRRTVFNILSEPFIIHNLYDKQQRTKRILKLMELVGLASYYKDRFPHEMSGGQKQRIGIARALALEPKLLVCDEPVSALDVSIQAQIINLLEDLQKELKLTYLFISHDLAVVHHISKRVGVMYLGKLVEIASRDSLYKHKLHPYTKALISAIPMIDDYDGAEERIILEGDSVRPSSGCSFHTRCSQATEKCKTEIPELRKVLDEHYVACHNVNISKSSNKIANKEIKA